MQKQSAKAKKPAASTKETTSEKPANPITPKLVEDHSDWKLDDAVTTLQRAEEIKEDKELMGKLKTRLGAKIKSISGIKALYESKYNQPSRAEEQAND